ncbi:hypothetical protein EV361DRAFT_941804 [Lentinula raphanica]|nr:hypothetical protein EV361DRAFT_941804 [Lentinula raphanica]
MLSCSCQQTLGMTAPPSEGDQSASLLRAYQQFDTLISEYKKSRQTWQQEADDSGFATLHSTEAIEKAISAKLKEIEQTLVEFTTRFNQDYEELVRSRCVQATTVSIRAGVQMEILRLIEMILLLPECLWHAESDVLAQLGEILARSQRECCIDDYLALQKASLRILERVFCSLCCDSMDSA